MKKYEGVDARGNSIRIRFTYMGVRCTESLNIEPTAMNLKYATSLRYDILNKISLNKFNYLAQFPESNTAKKMCAPCDKVAKCGELLLEMLAKYDKLYNKAHITFSTYNTYKIYITKILLPYFGEVMVKEINGTHIKAFVESLNGTSKRISNILIPLKTMLDDALNDKIIDKHPWSEIALNRILKTVGNKSEYEVEPFTISERALIIQNAPYGNLQNAIQFCFYTGLRISELIALKWDCVDLYSGTVHIRRSKVRGHIREATKTKAGMRQMKLYDEALEALIKQNNLTNHGNDDYVFLSPRHNKPWESSSAFANHWRVILNDAGVKYRNAYQMRHTFASQLLCSGENILKVVKLMGHANSEMLSKVYAKWIEQ